MYQVIIDDKVLYEPNLVGYEIFNARLSLEVNKTGAFDFKIYPTHPRYNQVHKLVSVIEVYQRGVLLFRGRPLDEVIDFYNGKTIYCEGDLAYLIDSIQRPYEYTGGVRAYLEMLIFRHNEQVEPAKQFTVGTVTVTDPNDYIIRADSQYLSTWEIIQAKLVKYLGGYIVYRHSDGINYIDYLEDSTYQSDQVIQLGDNILDLIKSQKGSEIVTALIPTGATITEEDEEGNVTDEYVIDITSVNDGLDYIYHEDAVALFGWIYKHVEYEDITLPVNLKSRAERELAQMISFIENIEIRAIDKNMIDVDFHRFRFFEYVKVRSDKHDVDDYFLIKKQVIDLNNAQNNSITIGSTSRSLTDRELDLKDELNVLRDESVTTNRRITETVKNLTQTVIENAEYYSREIREELEDEFTQLRSDTSTQLEQTKDEFNFNFNTLIQQFEDMDGETRVQFLEIAKYIRFVDGNIILGEEGNDLILRIANDRIQFIQNNDAVAYFSNNKLYVTDANILQSLQLGKFSFYPERNGNLSFRKVVG
ncbi:hypothetical protein E4P35_11420 [Thiopseudomonas sp. 4R-3cl]|nr:hypothetical protein E4P35_11420 [Thiopseudomonas sp. 4R-3cl]